MTLSDNAFLYYGRISAKDADQLSAGAECTSWQALNFILRNRPVHRNAFNNSSQGVYGFIDFGGLGVLLHPYCNSSIFMTSFGLSYHQTKNM